MRCGGARRALCRPVGLTGAGARSYLVRFSRSRPGVFALAYVAARGDVRHARLRAAASGGIRVEAIADEASTALAASPASSVVSFASIDEMIAAYRCGAKHAAPAGLSARASAPRSAERRADDEGMVLRRALDDPIVRMPWFVACLVAREPHRNARAARRAGFAATSTTPRRPRA